MKSFMNFEIEQSTMTFCNINDIIGFNSDDQNSKTHNVSGFHRLDIDH